MNDNVYWLVMPAAGRGRRLATDIPKQYLPLAGRSMLEWALQPFLSDERCRGAMLAVSGEDPHWARCRARLSRPVCETEGGVERADSVRAALGALQAQGVADSAWVLVHDAARPCVSSEEIDALFDAVVSQGDQATMGGLLAVPLADTLKRGQVGSSTVHGVASVETVAREGLWRALTPQMFRLGPLLDALRAAAASGRVPTDEAQAMEWQGVTPLLVSGESSNLKVTTMADLLIAEGILQARQQRVRQSGARS